MPRASALQEAFNAGEFSPRMAARVTFEKYRNGGEIFQNFLPLPQGGMTRRPGSRFVAEIASSAVKGRLLPFEFSTEQAYILELGATVMRVYRNQGRIAVAATDAAISNGDFTSNITGWDDRSTGGAGNQIAHDATNGRLTLTPNGTAADDIGWAEQDVATTATGVEHVVRFRVIGAPGDKIEVQVGSSSTGAEILAAAEKAVGWHTVAFTPNASPFYLQFRNKGQNRNKSLQIDDVAILADQALELVTPYGEGDLFHLQTAQSADVMYVCRGGTVPVYKLKRFGHASWSLEQVLFDEGPWKDENATDTTLTPGATTGMGVTFTASAVTGINANKGFQTGDIGRTVRIRSGSDWAWGVIAGRSSTTVVTVDQRGTVAFPGSGTAEWQLGEFGGTGGYPAVVSFVQQRLGLASTTDEPQKFWLSQSADIENFRPDSLVESEIEVEDDDAIDYRLAAKKVNTIRWMGYNRTLLLGTVGGIWAVESEGAVLAPADIAARPHAKFGASSVDAVEARNHLLYVQRGGRKLIELGYDFNEDGYVGFDLTVLADRILKTGVTEMAYQAEPDSMLWCVRADGQMASFTYQPDQEVIGWGRHVLGGRFGDGDAVVESIAAIPGNDGAGQVKDSTGRDELWLIVKRTVDGATRRYVEFFEKIYNGDEDAQADAYYFDSLLTYDGASTASVAGLGHLEGETVMVWADGALQNEKTVSGGAIELDRAASVVQVGLGYDHLWKSLKLAYGAAMGSSVGVTKTIEAFRPVLVETADGSIRYRTEYTDGGARVQTDPEILPLRDVTTATDAVVPLFTGEPGDTISLDAGWDRDPRILITGSHGPCTILALGTAVDTQG